MSDLYKDRYYNHFNNSLRESHKPLEKDRNYLMRFNTVLPYSNAKSQNSLSLVYSNSRKPMRLITKSINSKLETNTFTVINPSTDWEFICHEKEQVDVMSFVLSDKILSEVNFHIQSDDRVLDTPFDKIPFDSFFIESIYRADFSKTGKFLKHIFNLSNSPEFEFFDPKEIIFELLTIMYWEQSALNDRIKKIKSKKSSTRKEAFRRILKAYEYMHDNVEAKKIDIEDLAMVSGLSQFHLYNSFKIVFKYTPHQYLNMIRMKKAKTYLETKFMTPSEVANILQFPDLPSFSKLFKKFHGLTPSQIVDQ